MKTLYITIICLITFSIANSQDSTVVFMRNWLEKFSVANNPLDNTFTELTTVNLTGVSHGSENGEIIIMMEI